MVELALERPGRGLDLVLETLGEELEDQTMLAIVHAAHALKAHMIREIRARLDKDPTGRLSRSVEVTPLEREGAVIGVTVGPSPDVRYAGIQDQGGTIVARGKLLSIPLPGVPRGKAPRDWGRGELTLIPRTGKAPLLAVVSRAGKVSPKYLLVRSVRIPGVGYIDAAADAAFKEVEALMLAAGVRAVDNTANKAPG